MKQILMNATHCLASMVEFVETKLGDSLASAPWVMQVRSKASVFII